MLKRILFGAISVAALGAPVFAITAKDKMDTCKFGATSQKLKGAARDAFIKKCMANEPAAARKPAAAPGAAPQSTDGDE